MSRTSVQELDSFIKSFEDEISPPPSSENLEFLLEASDDELGLPPTEATAESVELGVFSWVDDQENYASFEYGLDYPDGDANANVSSNGEYVALDGLFNYTDLDFGSSDLSESLSAQ
ncbi:uncharacterized protein LOC143585870 [Bidens hawaiensis]|uniref:uncharacterized protein LOC143585870 n=1 Tax=Bidens hawaiensis TaxID=980011 RepID=UPI00404914FB